MLATVCKLHGVAVAVAGAAVDAAAAVPAVPAVVASVAVVAVVAASRGGDPAASADGGANPDDIQNVRVMAGFDQVDPAISCPLCRTAVASLGKGHRVSRIRRKC
jgi:hypothetical protein